MTMEGLTCERFTGEMLIVFCDFFIAIEKMTDLDAIGERGEGGIAAMTGDCLLLYRGGAFASFMHKCILNDGRFCLFQPRTTSDATRAIGKRVSGREVWLLLSAHDSLSDVSVGCRVDICRQTTKIFLSEVRR